MMLYLTGAASSLAKSSNAPQNDAGKSLGGYISSTPVPNGAVNVLFDLISAHTLEKRLNETMAVGLINQFDVAVKDVELKIISNDDQYATFKVGAVEVGKSDYQMEHIANRYQEPLNSQFFDASFYRAGVDIEIENPGIKDEQIVLYPFNIVVDIKEDGIEGTWNAFEEAFSNEDIFSIKRLTEKIFKIERKDESVLEVPLECSYLSSENLKLKFLSDFGNKIDKSVLIKDILQPKEAIGIWIQRQIKKDKYLSDEVLLKDFLDKKVREDLEEIELIITYNLVEETI